MCSIPVKWSSDCLFCSVSNDHNYHDMAFTLGREVPHGVGSPWSCQESHSYWWKMWGLHYGNYCTSGGREGRFPVTTYRSLQHTVGFGHSACYAACLLCSGTSFTWILTKHPLVWCVAYFNQGVYNLLYRLPASETQTLTIHRAKVGAGQRHKIIALIHPASHRSTQKDLFLLWAGKFSPRPQFSLQSAEAIPQDANKRGAAVSRVQTSPAETYHAVSRIETASAYMQHQQIFRNNQMCCLQQHIEAYAVCTWYLCKSPRHTDIYTQLVQWACHAVDIIKMYRIFWN